MGRSGLISPFVYVNQDAEEIPAKKFLKKIKPDAA